jgi:3-dehydroquinate dehydratase-1
MKECIPMGKMIGEGKQVLVCTPVVGDTRAKILAELDAVLAKKPDVVEWRADFFEGIAATDEVVEVAQAMKDASPETTMIFTIRSIREGGQPIALGARESIELTAAVCRATSFEYVDCELSNRPEEIDYLRSVAGESGTRIIASYHNFDRTPEPAFLLEKLLEAGRRGLDVAKVAVMPQRLEDVLTLLSVTLEAKGKSGIPLITMSMGGYGAVSRLVGGVFGSSLSFGVGERSSAPGQVPVEDLRTVIDIVEKSQKGVS